MNKNSTLVETTQDGFRPNKRLKNLIGLKFGFLLVQKLFGYRQYPDGKRKWVWECFCDCGTIRYNTSDELTGGAAYSCGCKRYSRNTPNQVYDPIEAAYRAKASNYKALAKSRSIFWDLSIDKVIVLFKGNCFYCGIPPSNEYSLLRNRKNKNLILSPAIEEKHKIVLWSGIDRLDNNKGYVDGNCVSCCVDCNSAKMQRSVDEFYIWIDKIIEQRRKNETCNN